VPKTKSPPSAWFAPLGVVVQSPSAWFAPLGVVVQSTVVAWLVSPVRVTVNVNSVLPVLPSACTALAAAIASTGAGVASSFSIVPVAVAWPSVAFVGLDSVTVNPSLGSKSVSPWTWRVIVCSASSAPNVS